jgi:hypothetical protein
MLPTAMPLGSITTWFTDIRKIACITFISGVLSALIPLWNATRSMIALESANPESKLWMTPMMVFAYLGTATMPMFYFALFRNEGPLHFPSRFRRLALAGILSLAVYVAMGIPKVIRTIHPVRTESVLFDGRSGATSVSTIAGGLLAEFSDLGAILLLIAFFRHSNDEPHTNIPTPRLLSITAKVAIIAYGLWLAINVVRLALSPIAYSQVRDYALRVGSQPPRFAEILADMMPALLSSVGLLIAPYIVYRSQKRAGEQPG